jgi:hypothetical protein
MSELFTLLNELFLLKNFMGKHAVFEVKEIAWLRVSELLGLVNILPDVGHILVYDVLDSLKVVASIVKVTQHEQ